MSTPVFAAVGHPNKGKSSIVATLAHDDTVAIGRIPGTTTQRRSYPMKVDGETLYTLVDTPGFQRARRALSWMKKRETSADKHPEVVRDFLQAHRQKDQFIDECELLAPLLEDGAGILYVVDGSVPYGTEYEAEMEILRWTGQPRMALINPIGPADHIEDWRNALGQYFSVVRVFNALSADFHKRIELLRAFGQLKSDWHAPLHKAVELLQQDRYQRRLQSAQSIATVLADMLTLQLEKKMSPDADIEMAKEPLENEYHRRIEKLEQRSRQTIEDIYAHKSVERIEAGLEVFNEHDLLSEESWRLFGLSKLELTGLGLVSGAAVGGMVDVAVGGASLLLGALIGGGIGAATTLFAADKLVDIKLLNMSLGNKLLVAGPTRNINFPHLVFNRARLHHALVSRRTHAERTSLKIDQSMDSVLRPLQDKERKQLEKVFGRLRSDNVGASERTKLAEIINAIFTEDDRMEF
jgi:hypothetical protein